MNPSKSELTCTLRHRWLQGAPADALALAEQHPGLANDPSAMAELAYEEFCLRSASGEVVEHDAFCDRFPGCRSVLRRMLLVDDMIGQNPGMIDVAGPPNGYPAAGEEVCGCQLVRELGRGAFSTVYLAREIEAGDRPVVLKLARLVTGEGDVLGSLTHEHVVPMLWSRHDKETGWNAICMPFLGSATLTHVIGRLYPSAGEWPVASGQAIVAAIAVTARPNDPVPERPACPSLAGLSLPQAAARLGCKLASALAYVHERGLAHGDVKPSNVLLAAGGQPLLLDFNLSRAAVLGRVGGTFAYMSPEHLRGFEAGKALSQEQAAASDVYALGVMLYELLTGELPHGGPTGENPKECARAMLQRQQTQALPVRSRNPRVSAKLAGLIEHCLSPDFTARPSAQALATALAEPARQQRRLFSGVLLLLFAALLGLGGGMFVRLRSGPAVLLNEDESREKGRERLREGRQLLAAGRAEEAHRTLHEADEAYARAIDLRKKSAAKLGAWQDYFDRGKVQLSLGDVREARSHFSQANEAYRLEMGPGQVHGPTIAYLAYSAALVREHNPAVSAGQVAVPRNEGSAAVRNNLAYSLMHLNKPARNKDAANAAMEVNERQARALLDQALECDPNCLAAYHNRARLEYQRAMRHPDQPVPAQASRDVEVAIGLSLESGRGESAELYRFAAVLYGRAAQTEQDEEKCEELCCRARRHAIRAYELGIARRSLEKEAMLEGVLEKCLDRVERVEALAEASATWTYLIEPEGNR